MAKRVHDLALKISTLSLHSGHTTAFIQYSSWITFVRKNTRAGSEECTCITLCSELRLTHLWSLSLRTGLCQRLCLSHGHLSLLLIEPSSMQTSSISQYSLETQVDKDPESCVAKCRRDCRAASGFLGINCLLFMQLWPEAGPLRWENLLIKPCVGPRRSSNVCFTTPETWNRFLCLAKMHWWLHTSCSSIFITPAHQKDTWLLPLRLECKILWGASEAPGLFSQSLSSFHGHTVKWGASRVSDGLFLFFSHN